MISYNYFLNKNSRKCYSKDPDNHINHITMQNQSRNRLWWKKKETKNQKTKVQNRSVKILMNKKLTNIILPFIPTEPKFRDIKLQHKGKFIIRLNMSTVHPVIHKIETLHMAALYTKTLNMTTFGVDR